MIATLVFAALVVGALMWAIVSLYRENKQARANLSEQEIANRAYTERAVSHEQARFEEMLKQVHETYRVAIERVGNMANYGQMEPREAEVEHEPTAEMRLGRAIQEDTIARGVAALRQEYEAAGIRVTEEELREEVISIVLGTQGAVQPASIAGLVRP